MKAIKNILVPVDFSDNAKAAFEYAVALADNIGAASVKALYIYDDYTPTPLSDSLVIPEGKTAEEYLADLDWFIEAEEANIGEVLTKTKVRLEKKVVQGKPADKIIEYSDSGDYDLIVMGTTGKKEFSEVLFGSTATNVSQKAKCPVLLVPTGSTYRGMNDIIYACDFDHTSRKHISVVADIANTFKSQVELLFVKTDMTDKDNYTADAQNFAKAFAAESPELKVTAHVIDEESVVEGVNTFAKKANADLVVMVTKHRSFWERIVHTSITKQVAMYADEPVLIVHVD